MATDYAHGNIVLFSGFGGYSGYTSDTWIWNGTNWVQQSPANSPPARTFATMTYDPATGNVVLFGGVGSTGDNLNDTWVWDGSNWTQINSPTNPSEREFPTMAYDPASGTIILFGGYDQYGAEGDTWSWNGSTWTQLSPATSPSARFGSVSATNGAANNVVLFGGLDNGNNYLGDTWIWNGSTWVQQTPPITTTPPARAEGMMAYDPATSSTMIFGGYLPSGNAAGDTWVWHQRALSPTSAVGTAAAETAVYFTITGDGTLPALSNSNVLLQGMSGQDFTLGTGTSTCTGAVTAGTVCTVSVAFKPSAPGLRVGAVKLTDGSSNLLATAYINGTGTGPLATLSPGVLTTVAGNGTECGGSSGATCGNGGAATSASLNYPWAVVPDAAGNLYISDLLNDEVRMVSAKTGTITTLAGGGTSACTDALSPCGDGGLATDAVLSQPRGLALDGAGNLYITDSGHSRIRKVTAATGIITTIAGSGDQCQHATDVCGDGGPATAPAAQLNTPGGVAVDTLGNVYISDPSMNRVREVTPAGILMRMRAPAALAVYLRAATAELRWLRPSQTTDRSVFRWMPRGTCTSRTRPITWSARSRRPRASSARWWARRSRQHRAPARTTRAAMAAWRRVRS
jgi:hypothetical protein